MFFKLILEGGHLGAGKSYEVARYFKGKDIVSVLTWAFHIPRAKKKESGKGIKMIKEISKKEYVQGKMRERRDPYLNSQVQRLPRTQEEGEQGITG